MLQRFRPVRARSLLAAAGLLLGVCLPARLRADEIQLYFDPGLRPRVIEAISQSQKHIAAELFKLSDRDVIAALAHAARRGVDIRILLCPTQDGNAQAAAALARSGVAIRWYPIRHENQIMHLKMALFDDRRLLFGSANWTHWGLTLHHEGLLFVESPAAVKKARDKFSADWRKSSPHPPLRAPGRKLLR